jgi:UDP-GlcNAc:undecaprenyl-phosphate GlcNAc-1-phosphate transferase
MTNPILFAAILGILVLLTSMALSCASIPLVRAWAHRIDFVDRPGARKFHRASTAYGGGLVIFTTTWFVVGSGVAAAWLLQGAAWLPQEVAAHIPGIFQRLPLLMTLLGGSLVLLITGWIDDRVGLGPLTKLIIQILVALGVAYAGLRMTLFLPSPALHITLTVIWIVAITNAINLLDNMDGLAAGVSAIAAASLCAIALQYGQWFIALFLLALIGALVGFLRYNFQPATIFMGDAGSLVIGFLLAALTIQATYYSASRPHAMLMPLIVLAIPIFDTTSVLAMRWRLGKPLYIGDTNHVSHRLVRMGMTVRRAVLAIYLMSSCTAVSAMLLPQVDTAGAVLVGAQLVGLLLLVALLEHDSRTAREHSAAPVPTPPAQPSATPGTIPHP